MLGSIIIWLVAIGFGSFALYLKYYYGKQVRRTEQYKLLVADYNNYKTKDVSMIKEPLDKLSRVTHRYVFPNTIDGNMPCHLQKLDSIELTSDGKKFLYAQAHERKGFMDCRIDKKYRKFDYLFLKERDV